MTGTGSFSWIMLGVVWFVGNSSGVRKDGKKEESSLCCRRFASSLRMFGQRGVRSF